MAQLKKLCGSGTVTLRVEFTQIVLTGKRSVGIWGQGEEVIRES